ncbi:MAG: type I 3-dehydroquinate dehydratase [Archaeoglobaceae archaeon]
MIVATVSSLEEIKLAEKADLIELRLDLGEFESLRAGRYIVTFRRRIDGGKYEGGEEERIWKLRSFVERISAEFVDLENDLGDDVFKAFKCKVIESYHNFKETPSFEFLKDLVESKRGDYFKIATMGKSNEDWRKIAKLLLEYENLIAFLMGEEFKFTRLASLLLGSPMVYCYVGSKKAPGQFELNEMIRTLEILGLRR